jgi:hypothetical protein
LQRALRLPALQPKILRFLDRALVHDKEYINTREGHAGTKFYDSYIF